MTRFAVALILFAVLSWPTRAQTFIRSLPTSTNVTSATKVPVDDATYGTRAITVNNLLVGVSTNPAVLAAITNVVTDVSTTLLGNKLDTTNGTAVNLTGSLTNIAGSGTLSWSALTANTNWVQVSPYDTAAAGTAYGPTSGETYFEFISSANRYRVRQDGSIRRVKLYIASTTGLTSLKFRVWRTNGVNWDWVADSANVSGSASAGSVNTFDLATPLPALTGDYVSVAATYSSASVAVFNRTTPNTYIYTSPCSLWSVTSAPSTNSFDWSAQTAVSTACVPVELYMTAPTFVTFGDSIMSGRGILQASFAEGRGASSGLYWQPGKVVDDIIASGTGWTKQNMGISGQTTTQMLARFTNDVLALYPRILVMDGGVNDLNSGVSLATIATNLNTMVVAAAAAGIKPVVYSLTPFSRASGFTLAMSTNRATLNATLATAVPSWGGTWIDLESLLGSHDSTGPAGNKWELDYTLQDFEQDGLHPNTTGYVRMAQAALEGILDAELFGNVSAASVSVGGPITINGPGEIYVAKKSLENFNGDDLTISAGDASAIVTNGVGGTLRLRAGGSTGSGVSTVAIEVPDAASSGTDTTPYIQTATFSDSGNISFRNLAVGRASTDNAGFHVRSAPDTASGSGATGRGINVGMRLTNYVDSAASIYVLPDITVQPRFHWGMYIPANTAATNNVGLQVDQPTAGGTRSTAISIGTPAGGSWSLYNSSSAVSYFAGEVRMAADSYTSAARFGVGGLVSAASLGVSHTPAATAGSAYSLAISPTLSNAADQYAAIYVNPTITTQPRFHWGMYIPANTAATNNVGIQVDQPTAGATRSVGISVGTPAGGSWAYYSSSSAASKFVGSFETSSTITAGAGNSSIIGPISIGTATASSTATVNISGTPAAAPGAGREGVLITEAVTGATDAYYGIRINPTLTLSPRTYYGIYVPARSDALTNNIGLQIEQPTVGATRAAAISIGTPGTGTTYALYAGSTNMSYFGGELRAASAFSAIGPTSLGTTVAATTANLTIGGVPATDAAGGHEGVYIFETVTNALDTYYGVRVNPTLTLSPRTYYGAYIPARSDALTNNIGLQVDQPTVGATRATAISIGTPAGGSWSFYNGSTNPSYFAGPIDLGNSDTTLARSAAGVVTIEGVKIATQPTTETLTYSGGTNVTITAGKGPNQRSLLTVTNNFQLLWSGLTDNDSGAVHLIPATTNVTVLVSSPGRAAGSSAATATGSTTLTITGATNGWAELAWSVVSVGGTNRVSVNLGAY